MTVRDLCGKLNAKIVVEADSTRNVTDGYAGDLLSFVMGRAPENSAWFTVMTNVNVCAVAVLCDVSAVVICEGCTPDDLLIDRAMSQGVNLLVTDLDIYNAVKAVSNDIN